MTNREKVIKGLEIQLDDLQKYADSDEILTLTQEQAKEIVALLKDRTKDYEAWAREIGVDTCINCAHASFNRNDGKSTCPIEQNFALVKDGYCHLFFRNLQGKRE